jgi:ferritin-like metal-binding protein YciE
MGFYSLWIVVLLLTICSEQKRAPTKRVNHLDDLDQKSDQRVQDRKAHLRPFVARAERGIGLTACEAAYRANVDCVGRRTEQLRNHRHKCVLREYHSRDFRSDPMTTKDLSALFLDTLKDIYYAEKQIYKSLPKMAKAANSDGLRAAFEKHHEETEGQIERLEQIFELLGKPARGKKCDAIEGILDEGKEIMEEYEGEPALDAGLLAAAQAVEHYEISRYGTLKNWAGRLSMRDAVRLLDETLAEEKKTDEALTKLADTAVNAEAA